MLNGDNNIFMYLLYRWISVCVYIIDDSNIKMFVSDLWLHMVKLIRELTNVSAIDYLGRWVSRWNVVKLVCRHSSVCGEESKKSVVTEDHENRWKRLLKMIVA